MASFLSHLVHGRVIDAAHLFFRWPAGRNGLVRVWRRGPDGKLIGEWRNENERKRDAA